MKSLNKKLLTLILAASLTACGGGGSSATSGPGGASGGEIPPAPIAVAPAPLALPNTYVVPAGFVAPTSVDLTQWVDARYDQGATGVCTTVAIMADVQAIYKMHGKQYEFAVDQVAMQSSTFSSASSAIVGQAGPLDVLFDGELNGFGQMMYGSSDVSALVGTTYSPSYTNDAIKHKVKSFEIVPLTEEAIKAALATGHPVIWSGQLHGAWIRSMLGTLAQQVTEGAPLIAGGDFHTWLIVGYDEHSAIVHNSWGAQGENQNIRYPWDEGILRAGSAVYIIDGMGDL